MLYVYTDLSKAFLMVNNSPPVDKLDLLGFQLRFIQWVSSYQYVIIEHNEWCWIILLQMQLMSFMCFIQIAPLTSVGRKEDNIWVIIIITAIILKTWFYYYPYLYGYFQFTISFKTFFKVFLSYCFHIELF